MRANFRLRNHGSVLAALIVAAAGATDAAPAAPSVVETRRVSPPSQIQIGPRPYYLVRDMDESPLKERLLSCSERPLHSTRFSIGHRGAALEFPEETAESFEAAARMGAGIIECDVTFTRDRQLVCRHSQCDLHATTNILTIPDLAAKCTAPFRPADPTTGSAASATCCTSDLTLADFRRLCGKMEGWNPRAMSVEEALRDTPRFRTDLHASCGTVLSHDDYVALVDRMGRDFAPELKAPSVQMPFEATYTRAQYAQQMIDAYKSRHIDPRRVYPQSSTYDDVLYWLAHEPAFGRQTMFIDERVDAPGGLDRAVAGMAALAKDGVRIVAPPMWALVTVDAENHVVPSPYARAAKAARLGLVTWTFERSGPLATGRGDYFYRSIASAVNNDGDAYTVLDVLARQVGIRGIFSDWPGTVTYYANCMGL